MLIKFFLIAVWFIAVISLWLFATATTIKNNISIIDATRNLFFIEREREVYKYCAN